MQGSEASAKDAALSAYQAGSSAQTTTLAQTTATQQAVEAIDAGQWS